jgi:hypothetical protein
MKTSFSREDWEIYQATTDRQVQFQTRDIVF